MPIWSIKNDVGPCASDDTEINLTIAAINLYMK